MKMIISRSINYFLSAKLFHLDRNKLEVRSALLTLGAIIVINFLPFRAMADGGSSFGSAVSISTYTEYTSSIAENETEYFAIYMDAGYSYLIYSYSQTGTVDMHYYIYNSSQVQLAGSGWQNVKNTSLNNGVVFNAPTSGTYYLAIFSHNNTQTGNITFRTRSQSSNNASINLGTCTFANKVYNENMTINGSIYNGWEVDFGVGQSWQFIDVYINGTRATGISGTDIDVLKTSTTNFTYTVPLTSANGATYGNNSIVIKAGMMQSYNSYVNDEDTYSVSVNSPPSVSTTAITGITSSAASSGGTISSDGGYSVTARGVCWSTSASPTTSNSKTSDGTGTDSFSSEITGLTGSTLYYVRSYATNSVGTAYGNEVTFTTSNPVPADPTSITASFNPICNGADTQLTCNGAVGTVYWYTGSCGDTQLTTGNPVTVSPTTSTTYFARNYNNSLFSAECVSLAVTVTPRPTVAQLQATGTGIKWYLIETGGSALETTTPLLNNTHYYASQTVNGVESTARLDVLVSMTNP